MVITPKNVVQLLALYGRFDGQSAVGGRSITARNIMRDTLKGIYANEEVSYILTEGVRIGLDYYPLPSLKDVYSLQVHLFFDKVDAGHVTSITVLPGNILRIVLGKEDITLRFKVPGLTAYVRKYLDWRRARSETDRERTLTATSLVADEDPDIGDD